MAKIHGVAWIIIGILIAFYSRYVNNKSPSFAMDVFFYIGLFFIFIGLVKVIILFIMRPSKDEIKESEDNKFDNQSNQSKQFYQQVAFCPVCGAKTLPNARFCHACGYKTRP